MSNFDNNIFQVIVAGASSTLEAAGTAMTSGLSDGVLGVFNAETNESLGVGAQTDVRSIYFAIGRPNGGLDKGAGQNIQLKGLEGYTLRNYNPGQPQIVEITGVEPACDTQYVASIELRTPEISKRQGYVQYKRPIVFQTPKCATGESVDKNAWTRLFKNAVDAFNDGLMTVEFVTISALVNATEGAGTHSAGDVITEANLDALEAYNIANPGSAKFVRPRITFNSMARPAFNGAINTRYYNNTPTVGIVSLKEGFELTGAVSTIQAPSSEEGSGYDIKQKEYHASSWNGSVGPYAVNTATGLQKEGFTFYSSESALYTQIVITASFKSNAGFKEYESTMETVIAIPSSNETLIGGLLALLDDLFEPQGFNQLADDYTGMNKDETTDETTSSLDDVDAEGIA